MDAIVCERHSPVRASLRDGGGDRVVISRLHGVARRLLALEQPVDEHARPAALIAVDHHARRVAPRDRDGVARGPAFEARVAAAEHDALHASVAGHEIHRVGQKRAIVFTRLQIQEVNARDVAFAAFRRFEPGRAAHSEELRPDTALLKFT